MALEYAAVNTLKAVVATAGTALLLARALARSWEAVAPRWRRAWDAALLALGLLAGALWWNLFQFNYPSFGHPSETFHYYLGSKYFPELRYTRLYLCAAVADAEAGLAEEVAHRSLRDLTSNELGPAAAALDDPQACKRHFTPERWRDFSHDLAWFRRDMGPAEWQRSQTDHGYNATPVWGLFGSLLARTGPASDGQILALRLLDPLLLLLGFGGVAGCFGWRTTCVALLFWGTHYPGLYGWVGGGYLRQLELAAVLGALCLLRRRRHASAGALLALAGLVRVYPLLLLAGPALQAGLAALRARRLRVAPEIARLALGSAAAVALLVPLATLGSGGLGAWREFAENSRVLLGTPLRNHVGLRTVLSHAPAASAESARDSRASDPYAAWKRARQETFAGRRGLFALLASAYVVLLAWAVRGRPPWVGAVLATGLIPVLLELTCYYSAILVTYALLWHRHAAVGVALCGLSALGWLLVERFLFFDAIFAWISLATVGFVVFASASVARAPREGGEEAARDAR
jgi:hypothetical protein